MTKDDLSLQMTSWLRLVRPKDEDMFICDDYQTDGDLFYDVLDERVPPWCKRRNVADRINELLRYEYHRKNALPERHALNDARANAVLSENASCESLSRVKVLYRPIAVHFCQKSNND